MTLFRFLPFTLFLFNDLALQIAAQEPAVATTKSADWGNKVASSLVYLQSETGSTNGLGAFVHPEGWILTSYSVVKHAPIDPETGVPFVRIIRVTSTDEEEILWASVYGVDRRLDLAILRLQSLPSGLTNVPFLPLATVAPAKGSKCLAIEISPNSNGNNFLDGVVETDGPYDVNSVQIATHLSKKLKTAFPQVRNDLQTLAPEGNFKVVITTHQLTPFHSGSPILNEAGEVVAVNKAQESAYQNSLGLDKISYHVHLEELQAFVSRVPKSPTLIPPYSKPVLEQLVPELKKDGDAVIYKYTSDKGVTKYFDLDGNSADMSDSERASAYESDEAECWKKLGIEFAMLMDSERPTVFFFDLDQNGEFEVVVQKPMDEADQPKSYTRREGVWQFKIDRSDFLQSLYFKSHQTQSKFERIKRKLREYEIE